MKVITHFLNVILWVLLGLIVFQSYTGVHIGILASFNLRLITDFFALAALALDILVYTGVMGGKNSTLAAVSAIFLVWIAVIVLLKYALKVSGLGWLFAAWDVLCFGFGAPYLVLRGYKK
ncbi:MAG: hypothetical protein K6F63_01300 [Lachnospiraceae bacterium]|nr:hypothetical protein [Lachnospiraceae bacterium]